MSENWLNYFLSLILQIFFEYPIVCQALSGIGDTEESNEKTKCLLSGNSSVGRRGRNANISVRWWWVPQRKNEAGMKIKGEAGGEGGVVLCRVLREGLSDSIHQRATASGKAGHGEGGGRAGEKALRSECASGIWASALLVEGSKLWGVGDETREPVGTLIVWSFVAMMGVLILPRMK